MTRKAMIERLHEIERTATASTGRSAWAKGVNAYITDLLEDVADQIRRGLLEPEEVQTWQGLRAAMLNGASCWTEYSAGGCALIYNADIAGRLCTPSELKRTDGGRKAPNPRETWVDVQTRALYQAALAIENASR